MKTARRMNIFCVSFGTIAPVLKSLGHNLLFVSHEEAGLLNVPEYLAQHNFKPDVIIQSENLGQRLLLEGLDELDIPKIFWAIDSHLNMHWHKYYARLFTAVLTPHLSLWQALPQNKQHPLVLPFTRHGHDLPFLPHAQRRHDLSFVGILNKHRPLRLQMCNILSSKFPSFNVQQGISADDMLKLYGDSRIVPNESISFEVNYRLLEAASAGAAVLTPNIGEDQNSLLINGEEMLVYDHAAHLMELTQELYLSPEKSEAIGFAAWKRVQASHLPRHRGEYIIDLAQALLKGKTPEEHESENKHGQNKFFVNGGSVDFKAGLPSDFWLTRVQSKRAELAGQENIPLPAVSNEFLQKDETGEILAFALMLLLEHGQRDYPLALMQEILVEGQFESCAELNLVGAMGALRLEDFGLAKQFFYRQQKALGSSFLPPKTGGELCLAFAKMLNRLKMSAQPGFTFNHKMHLPSSTFELLVLIEDDYKKEVDETEFLEIADSTLAPLKGMTCFYMGYLARLCIARPSDWRTQLKYGLLNLLCYRLEEGLFELEDARQKAEEKNELPAFLRVLKAHDRAGAALKRLKIEKF